MVFIGEVGTDGGGLTREFFRLISCSVSSTYMENECFRHNAIAYQECSIESVMQLLYT